MPQRDGRARLHSVSPVLAIALVPTRDLVDGHLAGLPQYALVVLDGVARLRPRVGGGVVVTLTRETAPGC